MKLRSTLVRNITQFKYSKDTYIFLQETEIIAEDLTIALLNSKAIFPLASAHISSAPY